MIRFTNMMQSSVAPEGAMRITCVCVGAYNTLINWNWLKAMVSCHEN
jgi:hypothetical protein